MVRIASAKVRARNNVHPLRTPLQTDRCSKKVQLLRGDVADPLGHVLDVVGGHRASMVLLKVTLHGTRVALSDLVTALAGEQRRGTRQDLRLLLQLAVDAPAPLCLIDMALDLHRAARLLVERRLEPARTEFPRSDADRAAVGVKALQCRLRGAATNRVGGLLDRRSIYTKLPAKRTVTATLTASTNGFSTLAIIPAYLRH